MTSEVKTNPSLEARILDKITRGFMYLLVWVLLFATFPIIYVRTYREDRPPRTKAGRFAWTLLTVFMMVVYWAMWISLVVEWVS